MTYEEFLNAMTRRRDRSFPKRKSLPPAAEDILAGVLRRRDEEDPPGPLQVLFEPPSAPLGQALTLVLDLAANSDDGPRYRIDFGDEDTIGRLDARRGRLSVEHEKLEAGTLLYIGLVAAEAAPASGPFPTPFQRSFHASLLHADEAARARALTSLAARLSWSRVKESLLAEAGRSARQIADRNGRAEALVMLASQYPAERQADYLEEAGRPAVVPPPAAPEPSVCEGSHWGRFVLLRKGLRHAIGYLSAAVYLDQPQAGWRAFCKVIHFPAEVEVAPELARLSLEEAARYDPLSVPLWKKWLERLPADSPLRGLLLGERGV